MIHRFCNIFKEGGKSLRHSVAGIYVDIRKIFGKSGYSQSLTFYALRELRKKRKITKKLTECGFFKALINRHYGHRYRQM